MTEHNLPTAAPNESIDHYVARLLNSGTAESLIRSKIEAQGLDPQAAATLVAQIVQRRSETRREAGQRKMLSGALWFIGGILVTVITYNMAQGGGTFIVAWGAVLYGLVAFFQGIGEAVG